VLTGGGSLASEELGHREAGLTRDRGRDQRRLVEAALALPSGVERHGHEAARPTDREEAGEARHRGRREERRHAGGSGVLHPLQHRAQRARVGERGDRQLEVLTHDDARVRDHEALVRATGRPEVGEARGAQRGPESAARGAGRWKQKIEKRHAASVGRHCVPPAYGGLRSRVA
jgi:hypothetical protein